MTVTPKIVVGICSSISVYRSCEIIRIFQKNGCDVHAIMTKNASRLISPLLLTALTGHVVRIDSFEEEPSDKIDHIDLAKTIELLVIAPATANMLGKLASGIADDFLSTLFLAVECPVLIAPAMNEAMYLNKQTQENIKRLKSHGVRFVGPEKGYLACKDEGWGRLASSDRIAAQGMYMLDQSFSLKGREVLITAGPTREFIDPVRYLTNCSSGKMGFELAREALRRGADVTLISGPTGLFPPRKAGFIAVTTAEEMEYAVLENAKKADIVIMAAAVSDYSFAKKSAAKIKKSDSEKTVELVRTNDILKSLGRRKGNKILVGFAAETENVRDNALKKIKDKNIDLIIANDVSKEGIGFNSDYNKVSIIYPDGKTIQTEKKSKTEISQEIFNAIEGIIGQRS